MRKAVEKIVASAVVGDRADKDWSTVPLPAPPDLRDQSMRCCGVSCPGSSSKRAKACVFGYCGVCCGNRVSDVRITCARHKTTNRSVVYNLLDTLWGKGNCNYM